MNYIELIGSYIIPFVPFAHDADPFLTGSCIITAFAVVCGMFLFYVNIFIRFVAGSFLKVFKNRRSRKQKSIEELESNIEIEEKLFQLKMNRFAYKHDIYRLKFQRPVVEVSNFQRFLDMCSAIFSAFTPDVGLESELAAFKARIALGGDSLMGKLKARMAGIQSQSEREPIEFNMKKSIIVAKLDLRIENYSSWLGELVSELKDESLNDENEESEAKVAVSKWEKRLGRCAYSDNFNSYFEENMNRWLSSQPWRQSENKNSDDILLKYEDISKNIGLFASIKLFLISWIQTILKNLLTPKDIPSMIAAIGFAPEVAYTYTAFDVIANGDFLTAISGSIVFTIGILALGQMCGSAFRRARQREGPIEQSKPQWRFTFVVAAIFLFLFGCFMVYVGASLRGTTGELIRKKTEILRLQSENSDTSQDADAVKKITEIQQYMEDRIKNPGSPYSTTEGLIGIFIYGVFFLSALLSRIFSQDPVFEFGLATQRLNEVQRRKLYRRWKAAQEFALIKALIVLAKENKIEAEKQQPSFDHTAESRAVQEEIDRAEIQIKSYLNFRLRSFGNMLMRLRRKSAIVIRGWLDDNCKTF